MGGHGCFRMCGVEVLDMCESVCVSVYGEVGMGVCGCVCVHVGCVCVCVRVGGMCGENHGKSDYSMGLVLVKLFE